MCKKLLGLMMVVLLSGTAQVLCVNAGDLDTTFNPSGTPPGTKLISISGASGRC